MLSLSLTILQQFAVGKYNDVTSIIIEADWSCVMLNDYGSVEPNCSYMCMAYWFHNGHELLCMTLQYSMIGNEKRDMP